MKTRGRRPTRPRPLLPRAAPRGGSAAPRGQRVPSRAVLCAMTITCSSFGRSPSIARSSLAVCRLHEHRARLGGDHVCTPPRVRCISSPRSPRVRIPSRERPSTVWLRIATLRGPIPRRPPERDLATASPTSRTDVRHCLRPVAQRGLASACDVRRELAASRGPGSELARGDGCFHRSSLCACGNLDSRVGARLREARVPAVLLCASVSEDRRGSCRSSL